MNPTVVGTVEYQAKLNSKDFKREAKDVENTVARMASRGSNNMSSFGNSVSSLGNKIQSFAKNRIGPLADEFDRTGNSILKTVAPATLLLGGAIGVATKQSWNQVKAVEQATVALRAYEKDGDKVNAVLKELIGYARSDMGVLFQRQDLFQAAQGLRVMGAETENLTDYVKIMSRSVGLGISTWDDLTRIIGRVGSTGRLTGIDFDNLTKAGFQLDDSIRNTDMSFEQLFTQLDKGIPVDALKGQANTIEGLQIRMQSAFRDLGAAILGVDAETSQFIKGGLGDSLIEFMNHLNEVMRSDETKEAFRELAKSISNFSRDALPKLQEFIKFIARNIGTISKVTFYLLAFGTGLKIVGGVLKTAQVFLSIFGGTLGVVGKLFGAFSGAKGVAGATAGVAKFGLAAKALPLLLNPVGLAIGFVGASILAYNLGAAIAKKRTSDMTREFLANHQATATAGGSMTILDLAQRRLTRAREEQTVAVKNLTAAEALIPAQQQLVADSTRRVSEQRERLNVAIKQYGELSPQAIQASKDLKNAQFQENDQLVKLAENTLQVTSRKRDLRLANVELTNSTKNYQTLVQGITAETFPGLRTELGRVELQAQTTASGIMNSVNVTSRGLFNLNGQIGDLQNNVAGVTELAGRQLSGLQSQAGRLNETLNQTTISGGLKVSGQRAEGGPVGANKTYLVGEEGPELFTPRGSGQIISNDDMGGSGIENNIGTINIANEADGEKWLRKLTRNQEITSTGLTPAQGLM